MTTNLGSSALWQWMTAATRKTKLLAMICLATLSTALWSCLANSSRKADAITQAATATAAGVGNKVIQNPVTTGSPPSVQLTSLLIIGLSVLALVAVIGSAVYFGWKIFSIWSAKRTAKLRNLISEHITNGES